MKKSKDRLKVLLDSYFDRSIKSEELSELSDYVLDEDYQSDLEQMFPNAFDSDVYFTDNGLEQKLKQNILNYIFKYSVVETKLKRQILRFNMASAAAVLILLTSIIWFYTSRPSKNNSYYSSTNVVVPGRNTATLKLANGKVIHLSESKTGLRFNNSSKNSATSQLSYNDGSPINTAIPSTKDHVIEVSTPKGGHYQVTLPDGTKVWLNAISTLKFPLSLAKLKDRKVELIGEAYFEVTKKTNKIPFIVVSKDQEVEVLGTHFNINAYADENSIKTTLLEGSVQVRMDKAKKTPFILKPGMQANLSSKGMVLQLLADPESAISWQRGYFTFNREHLDEIMRKVSRWYDVNVIYEDASIKTIPFSGSITRFAQVADLLKMLKLTGEVTFEIEARNIIVKRK